MRRNRRRARRIRPKWKPSGPRSFCDFSLGTHPAQSLTDFRVCRGHVQVCALRDVPWHEAGDSSQCEQGRHCDRPLQWRPFFSLASAVMTDDQTQQKYAVLPPVAPPGKAYFPGELANGLLPRQGETLTIQFAAPPAPPPVEGGKPAKQTVSFLLPRANCQCAGPRAVLGINKDSLGSS